MVTKLFPGSCQKGRKRYKKTVSSYQRLSKQVPGKTEATEEKAFMQKFGHSGYSSLRIPGWKWGVRSLEVFFLFVLVILLHFVWVVSLYNWNFINTYKGLSEQLGVCVFH